MRIAIVNDMPLAVEALRRVVSSVPEYRVAWMAADGEQAVRLCKADVPDLILMDLMMPRMDGAEATRQIMQASPCPILVVTATVGGHASKVFEAMGFGALDAVDTPVLGPSGSPAGAAALLAKIALIGKINGHPPLKAPSLRQPVTTGRARQDVPLVAIGASTGGPGALVRLLGGLPRNLPAGIAIVQHVDEQFAPGLAQWLGKETGHDVRIARPADTPALGVVTLASTNDHLVLTRQGYAYTADPADYPYRPSVDVFFHSLLKNWTGPLVGILLSGMGADGAEGLLALRRAGWHTIAQDKTTSVIYGMPKAAAQLNAAVDVLPIDDIAAATVAAVRATASRTHFSRTTR